MSGNVGLSCWQQFWNCICCCCPYEEPEAIQQRKPLLKDPLHSTTSPTTSSHTYSPPSSNAHTLSPDLTLGLPVHQVEIQRREHQDRKIERKTSSDDLRREESHAIVVSPHSPKTNGLKSEGTGSPPSSLLTTTIDTPPLDEQQRRESECVTTLSLSHLPPHDRSGSPSLSERTIQLVQQQGSGSSSPLPRPDQSVFSSPRPFVAKVDTPPLEEIKDQAPKALQFGSSTTVVVSDEIERRNSPPIAIPIDKKRESDRSRSSDEEEHTPPHSPVSNPTTPVRSPNSSSPATPLSSPYHDASFGDVSNWRDQVGVHESPHKVKGEKKSDGNGSDTD